MKYQDIKEIKTHLRNNTTPHEKKLWACIRKRKLNGRKFIRQHALIYDQIGNEYFFFVPDFYCHTEKLAIELDGKIHDFQKEKDRNRDKIISNLGIRVLRFKNEELDNIEDVLERIKQSFNAE